MSNGNYGEMLKIFGLFPIIHNKKNAETPKPPCIKM